MFLNHSQRRSRNYNRSKRATLLLLLLVIVCCGFLFRPSTNELENDSSSTGDYYYAPKMECIEQRLSLWQQQQQRTNSSSSSLDLSKCRLGPTFPPKDVFFRFPSLLLLFPTITLLDLGSNELESVPEFIAEIFPNVEILFLSNNKLVRVPHWLHKMPKLTRLSLKQNSIDELNVSRDIPSQIVHLILTENRLSDDSFAASAGFCGAYFPHLKKLMLAGNHLQRFSSAFSTHKNTCATSLRALELVRLARNNITELTSIDIAVLESLPRLAWFSIAGNPISQSGGAAGPHTLLPDVTASVSCNQQSSNMLGEGTSGVVRLCQMKESGNLVAVKTLKKISSDGSGKDEMETLALLPRDSDRILFPIGVMSTTSIVFPYLKSRPLGIAPNIETVTTDRFQENCQLSTLSRPKVRALILDVISAIHHLHEHHIYHGDIYAHNIYFEDDDNNNGRAIVSDFGAAFSLYAVSGLLHNALVRIEQRAVRIFLEDIMRVSSHVDVKQMVRNCLATHREGPVDVKNCL
eukprot:PhM_4_TR10222/c0_g1_i1/m.37140